MHVWLIILTGCASSLLGTDSDADQSKPIGNPFDNYSGDTTIRPMVLRSKSDDTEVAVEIPTDMNAELNLQTMKKPIDRAIASEKQQKASLSDREIIGTLSRGSAQDKELESSIENDLKLVPSNDLLELDTPSYLAGIDHIKQLFRETRFEAALLATDELLKSYPTDPKLHEMRGTLFDRLGQKELAIRAWKQSLELHPKNTKLKRFLQLHGGTP